MRTLVNKSFSGYLHKSFLKLVKDMMDDKLHLMAAGLRSLGKSDLEQGRELKIRHFTGS